MHPYLNSQQLNFWASLELYNTKGECFIGLEDIDSFLAVAKKHGVTLGDADGASSVRRRRMFFFFLMAHGHDPSYNAAVYKTKW